MKTRVLLAGLLVGAVLLFSTTGCEKLKKKLFKAFTTGAVTENFTIPVITDTTVKADWGTINNPYNIDSIIKAETGNLFSLNDIKKITVDEVKLELTDADADNNFANFREGYCGFYTDVNTTPVEIATGVNPDVYSSTWMLPPIADINLKDYLSGHSLTYLLAGKARRATNKVLHGKIHVKFHVE
ncbi:MAG: hypothetical protein JNL57_04490 [Bacteroidetes bacterium]|nr:hypothetical protein [Bacteroidota bacterium]